jgi:RNA polymerase sigma-70 factor, ECF subfamily
MHDLDAIVEAHAAAVWSTVYRLLNNHQDALDCYQETFLSAMRLWAGGEVRNWRAMLVRIATRRAVDRLRERYRVSRSVENLDRVEVGRSAVAPPEGPVQDEELREQVRRALAQLPAQQADAFWLRHVEGLGVDEIAQQMQIEPGHVRVLAHRASAGLRTLLGPTYGPAHILEDLP